MIAGALVSLIGVGLLAAGTPRQADLLFPLRLGKARRVRLRLAGAAILCLSLLIVLAGPDRTRQAIGWIGMTGFEAFGVALAFTLLARRRSGG